MYFPALDNVIQALSALPGIGRRSALRIAFHILRTDKGRVEQLVLAIKDLKETIIFCKECGGISVQEKCPMCEDSERAADLICVVEEPNDIYTIEKTGEFRGRYHVLNGALSPLDGIGPADLRIKELLHKCDKSNIREVLIATNPTLEGDATAEYIAAQLPDKEIRITRISHGIPTGTTLEFADSSALARSIRSRQDLSLS